MHKPSEVSTFAAVTSVLKEEKKAGLGTELSHRSPQPEINETVKDDTVQEAQNWLEMGKKALGDQERLQISEDYKKSKSDKLLNKAAHYFTSAVALVPQLLTLGRGAEAHNISFEANSYLVNLYDKQHLTTKTVGVLIEACALTTNIKVFREAQVYLTRAGIPLEKKLSQKIAQCEEHFKRSRNPVEKAYYTELAGKLYVHLAYASSGDNKRILLISAMETLKTSLEAMQKGSEDTGSFERVKDSLVAVQDKLRTLDPIGNREVTESNLKNPIPLKLNTTRHQLPPSATFSGGPEAFFSGAGLSSSSAPASQLSSSASSPVPVTTEEPEKPAEPEKENNIFKK